MKKNKVWYVLIGLFCLCTSSASVYAASYNAQNKVGVRFVESTSTSTTSSSSSSSSTSSTSSSTSSSSSSSSTSSSSTVQNSSSLPDTDQKKGGFLWWGNDNGGGTGGTTRYYSDDKRLPSTGELIHLALPFAGVFLVMLVFFYFGKNRRKRV
ncbi:LPXTG cell wall anchor domain-containing protein [Candidatus Enterococcus murrayae]|uniref:LPXTG cell wall anchor domain-containing protein n=1 Tax=Candidatus Enterococcus murrayae TaxID=2815321 RepID=A0ABS3HJQ0_9ENTE|nr:LPXTG cell wall anchor domain-containing protein [Enterococcus sp. MJM16]